MRFGVGRMVAVIAALAGAANAGPCERVAAGGRATCTIDHGGRTREYRLLVPRNVATPAPVVLNLHGRKGTAHEQESRLAADAERRGFILVTPQGYGRSWNAGVGFGAAHEAGLDDVGFIRAVIADLPRASATSIDARRVFATGLSNGARMVHRLGCEASDVIAAIASVAGPIADRDDKTGERAFTCAPARAVPVMIIHGKRDRCTPYDGGRGLDTQGNVSSPATAREWARRDACTTTTTHHLGSTTCELHGGCAEGAEVALCTIANGGHVWPGGPKYPMWQACGGSWPDDFRATDQMLAFFDAHPLPGGDPARAWEPAAVAASATAAPALELVPVETVDLPFDRSQLALTIRGSTPGKFDNAGTYHDGAIAAAGAISLYSRLRVHDASISALRILAQFRVERERVTADLFASDQQVTKASLGLSLAYLAPSLNLYLAYVGAAIAESDGTLSSPELMPTAIGLGTYRSSKTLTWIYGGGLGYAFGRRWLLPAGGVRWQMGPGWALTTILPIFAELRHAFSRKLSVNLALAVSGDRFNFANDGAFAGSKDALTLRLGQGKLGLGVAYRWNRRWTWRGELGVVGPRRLEIVDGDGTVMSSKSNGAGSLTTTVSYAFGNAPL